MRHNLAPLGASPGTQHNISAMSPPICGCFGMRHDVTTPLCGRISALPSLPLFTSPGMQAVARARITATEEVDGIRDEEDSGVMQCVG